MEDGCVFHRDSLRLPPLLRDTQHAHRERMDVRLSYDLTWLHRRPSISLPPVDSYATEGLCRPIVFKDCPSLVAGPSEGTGTRSSSSGMVPLRWACLRTRNDVPALLERWSRSPDRLQPTYHSASHTRATPAHRRKGDTGRPALSGLPHSMLTKG